MLISRYIHKMYTMIMDTMKKNSPTLPNPSLALLQRDSLHSYSFTLLN